MAKVEYRFDPFELVGIRKKDLSSSERSAILEEIADYVLESVLSYVGETNSPVKGEGQFPALSPGYKEKKKEEGAGTRPNLEENGDLLDSIRVIKQGDKLVLTVEGNENQLKADNHNKFSSDSLKTPVPKRQFIPNASKGQTFKQPILSGIRDIIEIALDDHDTGS